MNTTIDLKTAKTIEAMNQKINHMDNAVTDFFNKMSDVLERCCYALRCSRLVPSPEAFWAHTKEVEFWQLIFPCRAISAR